MDPVKRPLKLAAMDADRIRRNPTWAPLPVLKCIHASPSDMSRMLPVVPACLYPIDKTELRIVRLTDQPCVSRVPACLTAAFRVDSPLNRRRARSWWWMAGNHRTGAVAEKLPGFLSTARHRGFFGHLSPLDFFR